MQGPAQPNKPFNTSESGFDVFCKKHSNSPDRARGGPEIFAVRTGRPGPLMDRTRVDRAGVADHTNGPVACSAVGCHRLLQCIRVDGEIIMDMDLSEIPGAEYRRLDRFSGWSYAPLWMCTRSAFGEHLHPRSPAGR